jgi:hypothetical protein
LQILDDVILHSIGDCDYEVRSADCEVVIKLPITVDVRRPGHARRFGVSADQVERRSDEVVHRSIMCDRRADDNHTSPTMRPY